MEWKTLDTDLSAIDIDNRTFQITTDQSLEPLIASIGVLGLLNPPFILPTEKQQFMVVSGFKRVAACRHLGHTTIEARVLKPDTTREHLAETAICENMSQRPLNLVETSRATVEMFKKHQFDVIYEESDGGHTWDNWRDYLREFTPQLFQ